MLWAWDITVPLNTLEASPITQILKMTSGIITHVEIKFPAGCHGMVKVRLKVEESNLVPLSSDEWVIGDDESVPADYYYEMETLPTQLKFVACSPGTIYNHTITVRVTILPKKVASQLPLMERLGKILKYFGGGD